MGRTQRHVLSLVARHGYAVRDSTTSWDWTVGGVRASRSVLALYAGGKLEPAGGDPHRLKVSAEGRKVLRASLAVVRKVAA